MKAAGANAPDFNLASGGQSTNTQDTRDHELPALQKATMKHNFTKHLDCLTPEQRDVFVLRYGREGNPRSFGEIADLLGITKQAAQRRHARGLATIKRIYGVNG